ncbi:hypothetical protein PV433_27165 [Paenibacillus sp. GYB004]|uniref:hypothetical protein n=1 Tax=Paenibacillus sp. GYB004 TaxID=2994393 RepID=UPI002F964105
MIQITPEHLAFVEEAARAFEGAPRLETYYNDQKKFIALRYGLDRDCIMVYEFGEEVALFSQQVTVRCPAMRKEVYAFALQMEEQLRANDHKGGWENTSTDYFIDQLHKNTRKLLSCTSHEEYRLRCANIANFAMMLADNDRRDEVNRK